MDFSIFKNKKVLITGNTGFKGTWLTLMLLKQGAIVYGISKSAHTAPLLFEMLGLRTDIEQVTANLCDPAIEKHIESIRPDIIFHLAAQAITTEGIKDPRFTIENNLSATLSILEYLRKTKDSCTTIFITSDKCYLNQEWHWAYRETDIIGGKEPYGASKSVCEIVYASYYQTYFKYMPTISTATARAGNVIGGGDFSSDRIIPDCVRAWGKKEPVVIRNKESIRPWQHVMEPLSGYMQLCIKKIETGKFDGESFNFGPADSAFHKVSDVVGEFASHISIDLPKPIYTEARIKESLEGKLLRINSDKAESCLGWKPKLSFKDSIKLTAEWYDTYFHDPSKIRSVMENQIDLYLSN